MKLRVKDWADFQHYRDRSPPWIKLHRGFLDDYDFHRLPDASRALAPLLWLLASEHQAGEIDYNIPKMAFRLHMTEEKLAASIKPLIDSGFLLCDGDASGVLAECKRDACLETETETEGETETELRLPPEVLAWNEVAAAYGLAQVKVMSRKRTADLKAILKKHGSQAWSDALANVSKSRFLQGLESSWRADFDFMVHPAKFIKVIEGKYDNNDKAPAAPKPKLTPAELEAAQLERTIGLIRDGIRPVPFVPQLIRAAYASGKVTVEQMRACDCADFVSVNGHAV
jgi:hypothetical protein